MIPKLLYEATLDTIYMTFISTFLAFIIGLVLAIILVLTKRNGLMPNRVVYSSLDLIVNVLRSFPFIILIIVLFPLTKIIVGTSIGTSAAIVPLTIGSAPFIARLIENAMNEVDYGIIEAALSFGASKSQIIFRVILPEALPSIINAITLTLIVIVGFTAMAGTVGGGGLGDVAMRYGFQRFRPDIMAYTVIILIVLVQAIQMIGDFAYKRLKK
ncbi:D-methionine transport system permease protein MetI [Campylobacter hyointestinalis subsp. hyointestinalis]|uniref:D-methionine transport system permease protein MetI n=1 Tax=Campylobacter hyointestinalis subsp. hyointestinalis TaxID=91352 RepID=A0A0S4RAS8_CAMHY|nr:methionine ABC transporter permease [Campylobacter hyointestinalis]PPB52332.1 methionine ABC transporter permease [Campylobacter hyointestinalis subsp. hyointestinalis]PPB60395.1 methionine ABC transporter permease [Campylobacter hyointestinalis subsp. hyointestinalis]PPB60830.1 methionine ABC transporter permease [Campylobacter hyointestinalis subsp. hyointestinalis]CUU71174.1 D-methionine transport system permease protein MetI [Campylobacter hyointestinalis subsp. hyointestinalis]CUU71175